jgi:hypothetical protein
MLQVEEFPDIKKKAQELGCNVPKTIAILPRNFISAKSKVDLVNENTTTTVRVLWKQAGIIETPIEKEGEKIPELALNWFEWVGPTILFTSALITQNPQLVDIALGVISNYLTDWFKGLPKEQKKARLNIVEETRSGSYKRLQYEGDVEGLKELPKIVRSLHDEHDE